MTRSQFLKKINKKITGVAPGLFSDELWNGHKMVINELDKIEGIEYHTLKANYDHDPDTGNPIRKIWLYNVTDGKNIIYVTIVAAGAGSVQDPLEKYDIVAYAS